MAFSMFWGSGFEGGFNTLGGTMYGGGHTGSYYIGTNNNGIYLQWPCPASDDVYVSFWATTNDTSRAHYFRMYLTDGNYIALVHSGSYWNVYLNAALIGTGTIYGYFGTWLNIQVHWKVADADGVIETMINGTPDVTYTGDTKPGTSTTMSWCGLRTVYNFVYLDDVVSGTGGWAGDVRFEKCLPDADHLTNWLANGQSSQTAPGAPTVAVGSAGVLIGDYHYRVTFVDSEGETLGGTISALVQPSSQRVNLSDIPLGISGTTSRKLYRTAAGGSTYKLLYTVPDNTTTTYEDNIADGSLGANEPSYPHWSRIDDISDTDYIWTPTTALQDIHDVANWVGGTTKMPIAMVQWVRAYRASANNNNIKLLAELNDTQIVGSEITLTTNPAYYNNVYNNKPGGSGWTNDDINAAKFGVESIVNG